MKMKRHKIIFAANILICTFLVVIIGLCRNQWHIDEVYSYGLSNSYDKPFFFHWFGGIENTDDGEDNGGILDDEERVFIYQWHSSDEFREYITVQPDERFSYANVYKNQTLDVHPPLYYFLLHTICSFFPDMFSKWFALVPNIWFYVLSLIVLYKIVKELTASENKSLIVMAFWGLSRGALNNVIFLRMYMLLTLLTLVSSYLHITLIKNEKLSAKLVILIAITNLAGFLTQYYFYVFAFFIAAVTCFILLLRKKPKYLLIYAGAVLTSVAGALLIFPTTIIHVTGGAHGETAMNSLSIIWSLFPKQLSFIQYILQDCLGINLHENNSMFSSILSLVLSVCALVLFVLFLKWFAKQKKSGGSIDHIVKNGINKIKEPKTSQYVLIYASVLLTGSMIAVIMPRMLLFQDRYFFIIMPLCSMIICLFVISMAEKLIAKRKSLKKIAMLVTIGIMFALGAIGHLTENKFLCLQEGEFDINTVVSEKECFLVTKMDYLVHQFAPAFSGSKAVYQAHELDEELSYEIDNSNLSDNAVILFSTVDFEEDDVQSFVENLDRTLEFQGVIYCGKEARDDGYYLYNISNQ